MKFPSSLRYLESLSNPSALLSTLAGADLALNADKQPIISSGNFGSVFKISLDGRPYALKCFTRDQPMRNSAYTMIGTHLTPTEPYIVSFRFLENEITVFDNHTPTIYPVLLMDWVDGDTLTQHMIRAAISRNREVLSNLSHSFDTLAGWLLAQPFAHGDLKPDNMMVRPNGSLTLVDYDGMYLPQMEGWTPREQGTPEFQHPLRTELPLSKAIDHYSIALISITLRALALHPEIYLQYNTCDAAVLNPQHILSGTDACYNYLATTELGNTPLFLALRGQLPVIPDLAQLLAPPSPQPTVVVSTRLTPYKENALYGFMDQAGRVVIAARFDAISEFTESLAAAQVKNKWGFIDTSGTIRIPLIYDQVTDMCQGMAAVSKNGKYGYINSHGTPITPMRYDNAWSSREGLALVRKNNKYGFIDTQGHVAIPVKFEFAHGFSEGLACVMLNGLYGYINHLGKWVIKPQYTFAQSFRNGRATTEKNNTTTPIKNPLDTR